MPRPPSSLSKRNTRPGLADRHLVRAVVDVNVLISGVLSAKGRSAEILRASRDGQFELVISEMLLTELTRALAYPKLRKRIPAEKAAAFANWVRGHGSLPEDPASPPPIGSRDPSDDYLLALAINRRAYLVTGRPRPARPKQRPPDPHTRPARNQAPRNPLNNRPRRCQRNIGAAVWWNRASTSPVWGMKPRPLYAPTDGRRSSTPRYSRLASTDLDARSGRHPLCVSVVLSSSACWWLCRRCSGAGPLRAVARD